MDFLLDTNSRMLVLLTMLLVTIKITLPLLVTELIILIKKVRKCSVYTTSSSTNFENHSRFKG